MEVHVAGESQKTIIVLNTQYTYILEFSNSQRKLHHFLIF